MSQQRLQEREFARRQSAWLVTHGRFASGRIETDDPVGKDRRGSAALSSKDRPHPGEQLADFEGLYQVIVGAEVEPDDPILDGVARRHDDHRELLSDFTKM